MTTSRTPVSEAENESEGIFPLTLPPEDETFSVGRGGVDVVEYQVSCESVCRFGVSGSTKLASRSLFGDYDLS